MRVEREQETYVPSRRALLYGLAAVPFAAPATAAPAPDPVFAAIERFRAASRAHEAACDQADLRHASDRNEDPAELRAFREQMDALNAAYETRCTSAAGLAAIVDLFMSEEDLEGSELYAPGALAILRNARALALAGGFA